ncbi:MAG: IS1634 family transposase [Thermotogota bacterium]|nr:IS1634 family transposase [Thermotogota bacterium]
MFIREKIKRRNGKEYIQHQLIESVRTPAGPRQNIILNMGKLDIEQDKWKLLANAIEEELHNQSRLFNSDPDIKKLAQHYAQLIIHNRLNRMSGIEEIDSSDEIEDVQYEMVDVNSLKNSDIRSLGAEHVVFNQIEEYNLDSVLKDNGFTASQTDYARMLIAARLIHPSSERETARWLNENSALCELMQTNLAVYDNALHRTAVMIWEKHDSIEKQLSQTAKDLFSLREDVILYDLTNTYFEGSKRESKIAKPGGNSKEKRNDRPLVTLALVIDEEGFPKKSRVLEGNVSEPGTLAPMLDQLESFSGFGLDKRKTIVMDAGIATDGNLELIKGRGYKYIAVSRKKKYEDCFWDKSEDEEIMLSDKKSKLKIKLVKTEEENYLLCHSIAKEAKERAIYQGKIEKFEEALTKLKLGLQKKRTTKRYEKILERIGRFKEQYKVGYLYKIKVQREGETATDITFESNPTKEIKEDSLGEYVLRTNRSDLSGEDISRIHRSLTTIESCFKSMKSELGLRPNYHKNEDSTIAHIFITVIAYHVLAGILKKLRSKGIKYTWDSIRKILSNHARVTNSFKNKAGNTIHIRNSSTPTLKQREIYKALKLRINPLKKVKWIISPKERKKI